MKNGRKLPVAAGAGGLLKLSKVDVTDPVATFASSATLHTLIPAIALGVVRENWLVHVEPSGLVSK